MAKNKKNLLIIVTLAVIVISFSLLILISLLKEEVGVVKPTPICGNEICEQGEDCASCLTDCQCPEGKYCSEESLSCVSPQCGNSQCEYFETPIECCRDCDCWQKDEICNMEKNECEKADVKISDDEVKQLVTDYYKNQAKVLTSLDVIGTLVWKEKSEKKSG